jgi:hypothetical protein
VTNSLEIEVDDVSGLFSTQSGTGSGLGYRGYKNLDEVLAQLAGGGSGEVVEKEFIQAEHGLSAGMPVAQSGSDWIAANRSSPATAALGIVSAVDGADELTVATHGFLTLLESDWNAQNADGENLIPENYYWSSSISGKFTKTEPTAGFTQPLFYAITTRDVVIQIGETLAAGISGGSVSGIEVFNDGIGFGNYLGLNFSGIGITVVPNGSVADVVITHPQQSFISGVQILEDGVNLGNYLKLNFSGAGVTATQNGNLAEIVIPGGGSGGSELELTVEDTDEPDIYEHTLVVLDAALDVALGDLTPAPASSLPKSVLLYNDSAFEIDISGASVETGIGGPYTLGSKRSVWATWSETIGKWVLT